MGCAGFTSAFWSLCAAAFVAFILLVIGHAIDSQSTFTQGEIPLWYQIDSCQNTTGQLSITPTGAVSLCENTAGSCPTLWNMYISRAPENATATACPTEAIEQSELRIALEADDGFVAGAPYTPIVVLPTGASALISFKVEDAKGATLLPTTNAELGPGSTYPWRELSEGRATESLNPPTRRRLSTTDECCIVSESCGHTNDGTCDDGGPGSTYALCPRSTDCEDCGTPSCLAADESNAHARLAVTRAPDKMRATETSVVIGEAVLGEQVKDAAAAVEVAAEDDRTVPAPGTRRLLKGGSSSGSSSGGYSSSGRSSSGGYSSSRGYSTSGRTSGYSSGYSRATGSHTYSNSYSSYRSGGYYGSPYGTSYYGGGRSYGYLYGGGGYGRGHSIYIVGRSSYGCYSCRQGSCRSRRECGDEDAYVSAAPLDRYEFTKSVFGVQTNTFPAYLVIHNATLFVDANTVFTPASPTPAIFVTFFTEDGTDYSDISGPLLGLAYISLIGVLVVCCCCQSQGRLKEPPKQYIADPVSATTGVALQVPQPAQGCYQAAVGYPGGAGIPVAQAYQGGAVAMPMGQPMGQPPMVQGVCGAPMAQAYPAAGGAPMATAYPAVGGYPGSAPPSPPSPSEPIVEKKDE